MAYLDSDLRPLFIHLVDPTLKREFTRARRIADASFVIFVLTIITGLVIGPYVHAGVVVATSFLATVSLVLFIVKLVRQDIINSELRRRAKLKSQYY